MPEGNFMKIQSLIALGWRQNLSNEFHCLNWYSYFMQPRVLDPQESYTFKVLWPALCASRYLGRFGIYPGADW